MTSRILLSPPDVGQLEQEHVLAALRSGWAAPAGPDLAAFEQEMAAYTGTTHAVGVSSGTAALHLALLALGVGAGQVVVVPTLTFVATANAAVYTGAEPVFVDCDPDTGNVDPTLLAELLSVLRTERRPVGAVVPVDMFGSCADYDSLAPVCAAYGVPILEDAAEALGATYAGRSAGSFGRAAVLSFNGNKALTTAGGGMVISHDGDLVARCRHLANHARLPATHYEHAETGYNYRLSSVLAALGRAQLRRLPEMLARRRSLRQRYARLFADVPGVRVLAEGDPGASCWLTVVVVEPALAGWSAADLGSWLAGRDIETRPVWKPMHLQPAFAGSRAALSGAAQRLFETGLALPSGSALTDAEVAHVMDASAEFLARNEPSPAPARWNGARP